MGAILTMSNCTQWCLFNITFNFSQKKSHLTIWQNPLNRQFAYPKDFTYIIDFPCVTSITLLFPSIYLHIFHPITILTILRLLVLCINQCPRHMFVPFCFSISLLLSEQESFPKADQDRSAGGPHIPRFEKFGGGGLLL